MARGIPGVPKSTAKAWHPKLRAQAQRAVDLGCTIERNVRGGHLRVLDPDGHLVGVIAVSASDFRACLNNASDLRKALDQLDED